MINLSDLTPRQLDIYNLLIQGLSNKEIAARLYLSIRTVEAANCEIYSKLGMGRYELIIRSLTQVQTHPRAGIELMT